MRTIFASTIAILIIWNWGLTPKWVNITATVLLGIMIGLFAVICYCRIVEAGEDDKE